MGLLLVSLLCGWVLWHETEHFSATVTTSPVKDWFIGAAEESKRDCEKELARSMLLLGKRQLREGWTRKLGGASMEDKNATSTQAVTHSLQCLPAGTDPRPRFKE
jgi:hypothetical protein